MTAAGEGSVGLGPCRADGLGLSAELREAPGGDRRHGGPFPVLMPAQVEDGGRRASSLDNGPSAAFTVIAASAPLWVR